MRKPHGRSRNIVKQKKRARALSEERKSGKAARGMILTKDHITQLALREREWRNRLFTLPHEVAPLLEGREPEEIKAILSGQIVQMFKASRRERPEGTTAEKNLKERSHAKHSACWKQFRKAEKR